MAATVSDSPHGHGSLSIPKIKKKTFKDSIQIVSLSNRDVHNLLQDVSKNCLDVNFIQEMDVLQVSMVHNGNLQSRYVEKRTEMKESGRSAQTLIDQLGFRTADPEEKHKIAREGLCAKENFNKLGIQALYQHWRTYIERSGRGDSGVYLSRYFDVEVKFAWLRNSQAVEVIIFKYFTGKCKSMTMTNRNSSNIEPTPNFDSHVGNKLPNLSDNIHVQKSKSFIYLYEYTDDCVPSKYPRHCLPYAIIKVRKRNKPEEGARPVIVPRVIPSAAAGSESPFDKSCSSPSTETSKVNLNAKASSTKPQISSLFTGKILDSPLQSASGSDCNGSVNISNMHGFLRSNMTFGETQDVRRKDNLVAVEVDSEFSDKLSKRDQKAKLLESESRDQYLKRFTAANDKIHAEKNSKMLECLKFIPSSDPEESSSPNSPSTSNASNLGLPRTENQISKYPFIVVPENHNLLQLTDRCDSNTQMFNRHSLQTAMGHNRTTCVIDSLPSDTRNYPSFAGNNAGKYAYQRSTSAKETTHKAVYITASVWGQYADPRLLKRSLSSNTTSCSNKLPSDSPVPRRVEARIPIKSALKKADRQNTVKRKMTYSEYKQLKAQHPDAEKSNADLRLPLGHMRTSDTKDCSSENSDLVAALQLQDVQSVTQSRQSQTAMIEERLPKSSTQKADPVSALQSQNVQGVTQRLQTATIEERLPKSSTQKADPVSTLQSQNVQDVKQRLQSQIAITDSSIQKAFILPAFEGKSSDISLQELTKADTLQIPGKTSNIFNSFGDVDFQWAAPSLAGTPRPDGTPFTLDMCEQLQGGINEVFGSKLFPRTSVSIQDSLPEHVQKGQLKELKDYGLENIAAKLKIVTNLQTNSLGQSVDGQFVETAPPLNSAACSDNDADRHNLGKIAQAKSNKHYPQGQSFDESTSVLKSLMNLETSSTGHVINTKPHSHFTSDIGDSDKLVTSDFTEFNLAAVSMNRQAITTPTPWIHDQDLMSDSDDSQSLGEECDSDVETSESDYEDTPLPKSISTLEVGFDCYLLALDMAYQPAAIVVDYMQVNCQKFCKFCAHQKVPEKYLAPVNHITKTEKHSCVPVNLSPEIERQTCVPIDVCAETEELTCTPVAPASITLELQSGVENSHKVDTSKTLTKALSGEDTGALSGSDNCSIASLNQPNEAGLKTCRKPDIVAITDSPRREPASYTKSLPKSESCAANTLSTTTSEANLASAVTPEKSHIRNYMPIPASTVAVVASKDAPQISQKSSDKISLEAGLNTCSKPEIVAITDSLRREPSSTESATCLVDPSDASCSKSLPKSESCATNTLSTMTSEANVISTVIPEKANVRNYMPIPASTTAVVASKDAPQISHKSSNKISLVASYSDSDTNSSDEETFSANKATKEQSLSSKYDMISDSSKNLWQGNNKSSSRNENNKNVEPHTPKETSWGARKLEDLFSDAVFMEHLLKEINAKGSLGVRELKDLASDEVFTEQLLEETYVKGSLGVREKDLASDEAFTEHLLEETYAKGSLNRNVTSQKVLIDASNVKLSLEGKGLSSQKTVKVRSSMNIKTLDASSENREHQDVIDSARSRAGDIFPRTRCKSSTASSERNQGAACNQSVSEQNPSALSNTLAEDRHNLSDNSTPLSVPDKKILDKDIHAKIAKASPDRASSKYIPAALSSNLNGKQNVFPENSVTQEALSVTKDNSSSDSRLTHFYVQEKKKGSIAAEANISGMTKMEHMEIANKPPDKNQLQAQKGVNKPPDKNQLQAQKGVNKPPDANQLQAQKGVNKPPDKNQLQAQKGVNKPPDANQLQAQKGVNKPPDKNQLQAQKGVNKPSDKNQLQAQKGVYKPPDKNQLQVQKGVNKPPDKNQLQAQKCVNKPPDKNQLQVQKGTATSSGAMTNSSLDKSLNSQADNTSSRVKYFLDKVREGVEVKKHIEEEVLAFQKIINCEETNRNSESIIHKPAALFDVNKTHASYPSHTETGISCENVLVTTIDPKSKKHQVSQKANKTCTNLNKEVSISKQEKSPVCVGSTAAASISFQKNTDSSTVLSTHAQVWNGPVTSTRRTATIVTNNSNTAIALSHVDKLMVDDSLALSLFDTDYRARPDSSIADVDERNLVQLSYGDVDIRTQPRQNIPLVQQNAAFSHQNHYPESYFTQDHFLQNQGIQNSVSHVQNRHPYSQAYPRFPQQTWLGPQCALASVPVVDLGNTFMVDQDYRHKGPKDQVPMSANTVVLDSHKPQTGVTCALAEAPHPVAGRQCSLPAGTYSTETMNRQNTGAYNNQSSSFWLSRNSSSSGNISGLGFHTSGTKISGIPGLGDVATHIDNDGQQSGHFPSKANASSSNKTPFSVGGDEAINKTPFDAKAIWPEIYNSPKIFSNVSHEERCRSILNSLNTSPKKAVDTELKSYKLNEEDYSDDDQADSPLHVSHSKEHSDNDSSDNEKHGHSASERQNADIACNEISPEDEKEANAKLSKLLYTHLSKVISKVAMAPKADTQKNPLPVLELLRDALHKKILDSASEDSETSSAEDVDEDTDACPKTVSNSKELSQDVMPDNHKAIVETLTPTKDMHSKNVLLNTNESLKKECSEVDNSGASLNPDLEEQLGMETASASASRQSDTESSRTCTGTAGNNSPNVKGSLSRPVSVVDTKTIPSLSEKSQDSSLPKPKSSSPVKSPVAKENVPVERTPSELPRKHTKSPEDDTLLEENTMTNIRDENVDSPTNESSQSVDMKNGSQFLSHCKDTSEKCKDCSRGVIDANDKTLLVKEPASFPDSAPAATTDFDTPAAVDTTISVNSNGKVYLADVPLMALSYAREKILSEINRLGDPNSLGDPEVTSLPKTAESELTSVDIDDTTGVLLSAKVHDGSPAREIEEGEISSSSSSSSEVEFLDKEIALVKDSKLKKVTKICSKKRKRSHLDKGDSNSKRQKIVQYDAGDSIRKKKLCSKADNGSEKSAKLVDSYLRKQQLNADVICISTDSDNDCLADMNMKKEKTVFGRMNSTNILHTVNKDSVDQKSAISKACHNKRIFINTTKEKTGKETNSQIKTSENKVKSTMSRQQSAVSDYLRNSEMSESDLQSECVDLVSATASDTALLKPSLAGKISTALQASPEPGRADRYGHLTQAAEKLRKFSIFGENIIVQVFNEKSLTKEGSQSVTSGKVLKRQLDHEVQTNNNMPQTHKNLPLDVETAKTSDKLLDKEVTLLNAEKLLKSSSNSSSLTMTKRKYNTPKEVVGSLVQNIKCESREILPAVLSQVPTDGQKLVKPGNVLLDVQKQAKELLSSTDTRCQNVQTSMATEVKSMDIEESKQELYRRLMIKPEQPLKPESGKMSYTHVRNPEATTESDRADSLKRESAKVTHRDRVRPSEAEIETEITDSSPSSSVATRRQTDRRSYDRSSPCSRKRRRSSSSSSSYSRKRSLSSHSRSSRSSSRLSGDSRSYLRSRRYRRDKRSSSTSYHRSRSSRSPPSSVSYSRRKRRSSSRHSSQKYSHRSRKSVSSSRSRDSSTSDGHRRQRSKSPHRFSRRDSHSSSSKRSSSSKNRIDTRKDDYSQKSNGDKLLSLMSQAAQRNKSNNQHPFDLLYSITKMSTQKSASKSQMPVRNNFPIQTQPHTSGTAPVHVSGTAHVSSTAPMHMSSIAPMHVSSTAPMHVSSTAPMHVSGTARLSNLSTHNYTSSSQNQVLKNDRNTSDSQKATDQVKNGSDIDNRITAVGKEEPVTNAHKQRVEESGNHSTVDRAIDYTEMLHSHSQARSNAANLRYLRTHSVTVKQLIISQLGISVTDELKSVLPYPVHTVLSDKQRSKEERQRRSLETIKCCLKYLNIPTELVSKSTIEPVINSFGNPPFEYRLEHFSDDEILLEANVVKKCQYILEQQQGQVKLLSSFIRLQLGSQLTHSMLFQPGTYAGFPLPEDLRVPLRGFIFLVPKEVINEDIAFSIKSSLEVTLEAILGLIKTADFGREHFRVPEILLLEEEKFELYTKGKCFLILNKSLPKKVFTRLLTLKSQIESLAEDTQKSDEEKYSCSKQLIGQRVSALMSHVGNVNNKRVNKLRAHYHELQHCEAYMRKVIGPEGLRRLPVFDSYMRAVRHHFEMLNDEFNEEDVS